APIAAAQLAEPRIRYVWQDFEESGLYELTEKDEELAEKIDELPYRACLALTIAAAEWIVYRYDGLADIGMHLDFIEGAWAAVVDDRYLRPWRPDEDECSGPVKGPLACALLIVQDAIESMVHEDDGGVPIVYMSRLAARVLPDKKAFLAWRNDAIARLMPRAPRDDDDTLGDVLPREFFDPAEVIASDADVELLVARFLATLDPDRNPSLQSVEDMEELHFDGPHFTFDLARDRSERADG
ncbi:MAG: hypothetical protein RLZZ618_3189, partial [Pseudomonadota bacterium]